MPDPTDHVPAGDRLFALIASIPGSGSADWCDRARTLLDEVRAEAGPADRTALSDAERTMLTYALDQAQERIWSEDGFTDEDQAAVTSLRRLTAAPQQFFEGSRDWQTSPKADSKPATDRAALRDTEYRAQSHAAAVAAVRAAIPGMYAHVGFRLEDVLNETDTEQPARGARRDPTPDSEDPGAQQPE